jgi:hypothetical protein
MPKRDATPTLISSTSHGLSTWITGPIVCGVIGIAAVFTIIFFIRRRERKERIKEVIKPLDVEIKECGQDISSMSMLPTHESLIFIQPSISFEQPLPDPISSLPNPISFSPFA